MNSLSVVFSVVVFAVAFFTAYLLIYFFPRKKIEKKYSALEGLRGFLALSVFIHHASIWHQYLQIGKWEYPKSKFMNHLGESSVAFFFMITSFLFVSKLLDNRHKSFDWKHFFYGRFYRMAPVYFVFLTSIILITFILAQGKLLVPLPTFLSSIVSWAGFAIVRPMINGCDYTSLMGGAAWSLPNEWLFYFVLPILSLFILNVKPKLIFIAISIIFVVFFQKIHGIHSYFMYFFLGGVVVFRCAIALGPKFIFINIRKYIGAFRFIRRCSI
jgi:peptidoglycan/LPS O-acetylase OafA/YrhL